MPAENLSAKQVAKELDTNPRTLRKFLREHLEKEYLPGQGGRYVFFRKDLPKLKKAFKAWSEPTPTVLPDELVPKSDQAKD